MTKTDTLDVDIIVRVPEAHACYVDHFPNNPLVPGALLLTWIMAAIERHRVCKLILIKHIKFLAAVKPADLLRIVVNVNPANGHYSIRVLVRDTTVIKGVFQAAVAPLAGPRDG